VGVGIRICTIPQLGINLGIKVDHHRYQKNQIPDFDIYNRSYQEIKYLIIIQFAIKNQITALTRRFFDSEILNT
jgi:hypothetical protein